MKKNILKFVGIVAIFASGYGLNSLINQENKTVEADQKNENQADPLENEFVNVSINKINDQEFEMIINLKDQKKEFTAYDTIVKDQSAIVSFMVEK